MVIDLPATLTLDSDNLGVVEFSLIDFSLFYASRLVRKDIRKGGSAICHQFAPRSHFCQSQCTC